MIIALPLKENLEFSPHYGAATQAGFIELDPGTRTVLRSWAERAPEGGPCSWASWFASQGVTCLLAGGIGLGARQRMADSGIEVYVGAPSLSPLELVEAFLRGDLAGGANACGGGAQHSHEGGPHHSSHDNAHSERGCSCSH